VKGGDTAHELRTDFDPLGGNDFWFGMDFTRPKMGLEHILDESFLGLTFDQDEHFAHD
jgi:hypothetical protein